MPKDPKDDSLTSGFNKAAQKTPQEALLEAVRKTRNSLALTEAVKAQDWQEAARLADAGADPLLRSAQALNALFVSDAPEAVDLADKLDLAPALGLEGIPYIMAAQQGDLARVEEGLQKGLNKTTKSNMVFAALRKGRDAAADRVLQDLPVAEMEENALFALLLHRPALYETAAQNKPPPDYIAHFYNACLLKDAAAMDLALQKMIDNKKSLPLFMFLGDDFDGGGFNRMLDYTDTVLKSNHLPAIGKYLDNFLDDMTPGRQTVISLACSLEEDQPGILKKVMEHVRPDEYQIRFAVTNTQNSPETARYFMQNHMAEVKHAPLGVLHALAQEKGDALQKAVEEEGLALPGADTVRAKLIAAAIHAGNAEGEAWLLQKCEMTPELLQELQGSHNYDVIRRAAEIGGEMRFKDDALFWKAAAENDRETIDAFPRQPALSTGTPWRVHAALREVIKRGDFDLLADILKNTDWEEKVKDDVFGICLGSAPAMQAALDAGFTPPEKLDTNETISIARGDGAKTLDWLAENAGIELGDDIAANALRSALQHNAPGMVEYLLANGAGFGKETSFFEYAVREMATEETLQTVEKWITRTETREAPELAADIAGGKPLFGGADSPAVQAAYANRFADIIRHAAKQKSFDPALLVSTADQYGNTVLDILGAHGRLNDVFAAPALWKDGDAVSFIRENSSPLYHDQCDFAGLKAAIDLLRLQDKGRQDRFKLK